MSRVTARVDRKRVDLRLVDKIKALKGSVATVRIPVDGEHVSTLRSRYYQHLWLVWRIKLASKLHGNVLHVWIKSKD